MATGESLAHLELKRLALIWAQANGYPIAACEVSLPNLRFRLDVGAYKPAIRRELRPDPHLQTNRARSVAAIGVAAVFECKATRTDLVRDCRSAQRLLGRMKDLMERRLTLERLLKIHYPSLRHGDALWPEYESFSFDQVEHAPYRKVIKELGTLSRQLHGQTKMESLFKWQAANLHYLVVEPDVADPHEIPLGWGLLVRTGSRLELRMRPEWREIEEATRLLFLHRVAMAGTRATNREAGIAFCAIENERRGLAPADGIQIGRNGQVSAAAANRAPRVAG